ncbi:myb-binding protein 1A-like protein [Stigmatopora argus]
MVDLKEKASKPERTAGVLQQNRVFLDFFWDLAKPEQEVRVSAVENLLKYLKDSNKEDELEYTLKRLVDGLAHTREVARPGFSLALGQVLSAFEDLTLQDILGRIQEKYSVQKATKKFIRNAAFGSLFGVLALHQSGRLFKEPLVVLGCVQLLQNLSQHRQHLKHLPSNTMMDILNEVPEKVFQEVLLTALQSDLKSAFQTPEQLQLLLVALERFPQTLEPKKLKKLLGSSTIIHDDNIVKLTHLCRLAAQAVKKECVLPPVALGLLKLSLREDSFQLFWTKGVIGGMLRESWGPTHFMAFRLLGRALPFLSLLQLKEVLSGEAMIHYGEHVVSAQKQERFKLAPEMETFVSDFLEGCEDDKKQLAVMVGFSSLVNQGYPVVPSVWRVVQHLRPSAVQEYVAWLRAAFLRPRLEEMLNFTSDKQKKNQEETKNSERESIFRLRKWIVARLASIVDNHQVKKDEELIMEIARFVFFHAFFATKKSCKDIPETQDELHVPLDEKTRTVLVSSFFGLLLSMHNLPQADEASKEGPMIHKRTFGVTSDGSLWIYRLAQYAEELLRKHKFVHSVHPFNDDQRLAWESMLESVANLQKKAKKGHSADESNSFQQLFLLVGMNLFKAPDELVDVMKDLQSCVEKAQEKKAKKKKKADKQEEAEPHWVEVLVDILLSLLSQPSRHIRQVCKTVFGSVSAHVNAAALTAILDVLDPDKDDDEDGPVLVEDDAKKSRKKTENDDEDMEDESDGSDGSDDDSEEDDNEEDMEDEEVDQNFKLELMKVLQQKNTMATEEEDSDDDLDDKTMMKLDKNLSVLFSEQKKKVQAKKDGKDKMRKEKLLVRNFKIKVLDLVEVFVAKQAGSPLVLDLLEPLLYMIERGMRSGNEQQEQEFLRRVADIFRNQLCRSKTYCKTVDDRQEQLHNFVEKVMAKTQRLSESSVALYYFSAGLYVIKVLRGPPIAEKEEATSKTAEVLRFMGNVDVERMASVFREMLLSFMSRRNSPLTTQMFTDLFNRFPVLCVNLLDATVQHITSAVREHQQGQACVLVLRAMQNRDVQQLMKGKPWLEFCTKVAAQLAVALKLQGQTERKALREKVVKALELCQFLAKHVHQQKLAVDLLDLKKVLQHMPEAIEFKKSGTLEDTFWAVMKHFGVVRPKVEKVKPDKDGGQPPMPQQAAKKKKGFLPESKKRKKRPQPVLEPAAATANSAPTANKAGVEKKGKKKRKQAADAEAAQAGPAKKKKKNEKKKNRGGQV